MSEGNAPIAGKADVRKARISPVWIIPIVAIALAGYLGYRTVSEKGPTITLYFETASGLEAGKTKVKFKAVEVGSVTAIDIRDEKPQIVVTCELDVKSTGRVREKSQFWVVRPRIGASGVSGLGTLVSGAYINFVPGPEGGKAAREFTGLEDPPEALPDDPRLRLVLHSRALGSLDPDSPIFYRQVQVGKIGRSQLTDDNQAVEVEMLIEPQHAGLVHSNSRFWNAGGIDVSLGLGGVDVHTESLVALLIGGVAFDSPAGGEPAAKDAKFTLHKSRSEVEDAYWRYGGLHVVVEAVQSGGVKEGDFVYYKEERVGSVVSTALSNDSRTVRIHLNILSRYAPLVRTNSVFWNASGISANLGLTGLHIHAESLESLLAGGIAFATPNSPGGRVKSGSVFKLHPEVKDDWLKWSPTISRGGKAQKHAAGAEEADAEEHHGPGKFFHHEDKKEEDTADEDHPKDHEKHGFFHRLLH
jgi:paraquat-inducible protein B